MAHIQGGGVFEESGDVIETTSKHKVKTKPTHEQFFQEIGELFRISHHPFRGDIRNIGGHEPNARATVATGVVSDLPERIYVDLPCGSHIHSLSVFRIRQKERAFAYERRSKLRRQGDGRFRLCAGKRGWSHTQVPSRQGLYPSHNDTVTVDASFNPIVLDGNRTAVTVLAMRIENEQLS